MAFPLSDFPSLDSPEQVGPCVSQRSGFGRLVTTAALFLALVALKLAADAIPTAAQLLLAGLTTATPALVTPAIETRTQRNANLRERRPSVSLTPAASGERKPRPESSADL